MHIELYKHREGENVRLSLVIKLTGIFRGTIVEKEKRRSRIFSYYGNLTHLLCSYHNVIVEIRFRTVQSNEKS